MNLISPEIQEKLNNRFLLQLSKKIDDKSSEQINDIFKLMYNNIPDNKRISYGEVHVVKTLANYLFENLNNAKLDAFKVGESLFEIGHTHHVQGVGLGILTNYAVKDPELILKYFILAADSDYWNLREYSQMYFRKFIKNHPERSSEFLLEQVKSKSENLRRFVSETLRPVQENRWFAKDPEYALRILKHLFKETKAYPRTSVGNNLSDIARKHPEITLKIAKELVDSNDKNSYWIAYRSCRNLVKTRPIEVMDILKIDEYKYKSKKYLRSDY